jgi:hypothetical protein
LVALTPGEAQNDVAVHCAVAVAEDWPTLTTRTIVSAAVTIPSLEREAFIGGARFLSNANDVGDFMFLQIVSDWPRDRDRTGKRNRS